MKYNNPVHRGFFPDPSVVRVGEDYYKVNSTFQYFPSIAISHSKDLVNWEIIGYAITNSDYLNLSEIGDSRGIWAPDISYYNGKFYIFATLRHNDNDIPMRSQLVMTSDKAEGPYSKPNIIPVDNIDPSHFVDDDGKHYMIIAPGITVVPLNDDCSEIVGEIKQVWKGTGERCPEGPHILKHNGYYYAILAEGGTGYGHRINVARSKSLYGEYEESPYNPVMMQKDSLSPIQRCGHGKIFDTQNGEWWCTYLCGRPNGGNYTTIGRETALDKVTWTEDGWFKINNGNGPSLENDYPNLPVCKYEKKQIYDFSLGKIDLDFLWVRNPDCNMYEFTNNSLRIYTSNGNLNEIMAVNTLLHREEELNYKAEVEFNFLPKNEYEKAGLTCYYSTATYIRFNRTLKGLELVINRNKGEEIIKQIEIDFNRINLKVVVKGQTRAFYYKNKDNKWIEFEILYNCTFLCDEGVKNDRKRHTGTLVGLFANSCGSNSKNYADFKWFKYQNIY
ncbi:MAG: glycoside hydrolase family 43 protein [Lachnospirales bacterium]